MQHSLKLIALGFASSLVVSASAAATQDALTSNPAAVRAGAYVLDPAHSKITWSVSHLGFSTYVGQFTGVAGTLQLDPKAPASADLQVKIDTASVGTFNPALDTHLKSPDFLDAAKFPSAVFRAAKLTQTGPATAQIAGELTLHGVTRPVTLEAKFNQAGVNPVDKKYSLGFDGTAKIRRSEFGITAYVPAVSDQVTLQIEAEFKPAA